MPMAGPTDARSSRAAAHLRSIGAYGFDRMAPQIMAALVTDDPLLLIGASGTGKSYLLNSLSEALGLEHRHYNASLISFDDLVGFPFPDEDRRGVSFLETPATIWGAESVLVDEISRCKPEHQNRLFSLVHERRVQGIALERLRYRWTAMNPCSWEQDERGGYSGSEPLDQALADRFGLFISVADWAALDEADRLRIADPSGEGAVSRDHDGLKADLELWRVEFAQSLARCPGAIVGYAVTACTFLNGHGLRVSPRRSRFMARSLLAVRVIAGGESEELFRDTLSASLPHPTWGCQPEPALVEAAHRLAWDAHYLSGQGQWVHRFHAEPSLPRKLRILLEAPDPDASTQAIAEFIGSGLAERVAAFCLALYPAALHGLGGIGAEGVNDLGKIAMPILAVDGQAFWSEPDRASPGKHPDFLRYQRLIDTLREGRRTRACQLFNHLLVKGATVDDAAALEREFNECVAIVGRRLRKEKSGSSAAADTESASAGGQR